VGNLYFSEAMEGEAKEGEAKGKSGRVNNTGTAVETYRLGTASFRSGGPLYRE
jgi:hypothetical protein